MQYINWKQLLELWFQEQKQCGMKIVLYVKIQS